MIPEVYARCKENATITVTIYDTLRRRRVRADLRAELLSPDELLRFFNAVHNEAFEEAVLAARHLSLARERKDRLVGVSTSADAYEAEMAKKRDAVEEKVRKKEEKDQRDKEHRDQQNHTIQRLKGELKGKKGDFKGKGRGF